MIDRKAIKVSNPYVEGFQSATEIGLNQEFTIVIDGDELTARKCYLSVLQYIGSGTWQVVSENAHELPITIEPDEKGRDGKALWTVTHKTRFISELNLQVGETVQVYAEVFLAGGIGYRFSGREYTLISGPNR
ncbi:hypothetical protein EC919_10991 [Pseudomonas graminis]|uniref:hypothetical protein n=1 Tax=Pseudomonas graminis TaxID=158627 RepID=UPI00105B91DF|nr:hypothetical protein [Pseudomonas graminis]TDV48147.1 hypothetical protein EC919_10991 [Pseudomonas graminis]